MSSDAYDEGYKAFYEEKSIDDNPYPVSNPEIIDLYDDWRRGYMDADIYESSHYP